MKKACPKCGCQVYDPFIGQTMIHSVNICSGIIKPPKTKIGDVTILKNT